MSALLSCVSSIAILFIVQYSVRLILKAKYGFPLTTLPFLILTAILLSLNMLDIPWPDMPWPFPLAYHLYFVLACLLFSGKLPEKIIAFLSQLFAGCVISGLAHLAARAFLPQGGTGHEALRLSGLLVLGSLYVLWMHGSGRRIMRELFAENDGWVWVLYAFGPCLGCILLSDVFRQGMGNGAFLAVSSLTLLFAVWSFSVLILAILTGRLRAQTAFDLELARGIINATSAQTEELQRMMEASGILRHDCKHHLHVAQMLLETGHIEEAKQYLLTFGTKCDEGVLPLFCANAPVNALLGGYWRRCKEEGIAFSALITLPKDPPMDSFELCTLLSNLLENALEACRRAPGDQRRIMLDGAPKDGQLWITVKNGFDGKVLTEEDHIVSRKGALGGLGIKSIRTIAARHKGEYVPAWEGHTFTASVVLRQ